jgi:threonine/homoserine/homoserine lactone efflux protein
MSDALPGFCLVVAAFVALPGPSNLFVAARSAQDGLPAAVAGAVGVATGSLAYVIATALGLAALLAASRPVLAALHYAGAAYLCWMGIERLRRPDAGAAPAPAGAWRCYRQGLLVELANPKVALFFLALVPQFVRPGAGPAAIQSLVLGGAFVLLGLTSDCVYACLCRGIAGRRLRATGLVYLGLGGWTALTRP